MQQWHGLCLERRTQGDLRPECIHSPLNDLLGSFRLELIREPLDFQWCQHHEIIPVIIPSWIQRRLRAWSKLITSFIPVLAIPFLPRAIESSPAFAGAWIC